jgi:hypothetical protein
MTDKELAEILKFSSSNELYIVTWNKLLKRLFVPFKVRVRHEIGGLKQNQIVWVEAVKVTQNLVTTYIIQGLAYYYYHFDILID